MAPKFALFTKGSKLALNQGFQNRFLVTTVSRQALDIMSVTKGVKKRLFNNASFCIFKIELTTHTCIHSLRALKLTLEHI